MKCVKVLSRLDTFEKNNIANKNEKKTQQYDTLL